MKFLWITLILALLAVAGQAKRKRKFEGDFEFAEEVCWNYAVLLPFS